MSSCPVKPVLFTILLVTSPWGLLADEPSYHDKILAISNRYRALENRKDLGGSLSPAEETERQCLLGQLIDQDPVSALAQEIVAEFQALQQGSRQPEERATADKLLELSQIAIRFEGRASTLAEAKSFANVLRKFVVRRDVEGARAWANAQ